MLFAEKEKNRFIIMSQKLSTDSHCVILSQACTTQKVRKTKFIKINLPRAAKVYFFVVWKKF